MRHQIDWFVRNIGILWVRFCLSMNGCRDPWISPKDQVEANEAGNLCSMCTCNVNEFNGQAYPVDASQSTSPKIYSNHWRIFDLFTPAVRV